MPHQIVAPIIDYKMRGFCVKPYHNHKKGCPNFNYKKGCPPQAPFFDKEFDMGQPIYAIWNEFDFAAHTQKMRMLHPEWTEPQIRCCLYWQPKARQMLLNEIKLFIDENPHYTIERCPEATGIDITNTMKDIGIILEWPPEIKTYQIVLAALKKETHT